MTMITPSYLGETIEYSSLHACRSTLEDPTASTWNRVVRDEGSHVPLFENRPVCFQAGIFDESDRRGWCDRLLFLDNFVF